MPRLTEQEQQEIIRFIEADRPLPDKYQVVFHDVAAIEVKPHVKTNAVAVELTDFSVFYSQDSIANAEAAIKNKGSRIVAERGQIVKVVDIFVNDTMTIVDVSVGKNGGKDGGKQ